MSDERALLAAICAHPDEDTPRLAYADWLDEFAGSQPVKKCESVRARAELIRVQCELTGMPPDEVDVGTATRRVELELREEELLANTARRKSWAKPVNPPPAGYDEFVPNADYFVRGFPDFCTNWSTERNGFLTIGEALFDISPVHSVYCRNVHGADAERFFALPWLPRVRRLSVGTDGVAPANTEKLFAAPLANLEELELRSWEIRAPGAPGDGGVLVALNRLDLKYGTVSGPQTFERLGELLPSDVRLGQFTLDGCRYGIEELRTLAALPQLGRLERLRLVLRSDGTYPTPPMGPEGMRALTAAPFWKNLCAFECGYSEFAVTDLAAAPPAPNLRTLTLTYNLEGAVETVASAPLLASVTALEISGTLFSDEDVVVLARSPHLGRLLSLSLSGDKLGPKAVKALANAPFAANLVRLRVTDCSTQKAAVDVFVGAAFPRLRFLDITGGRKNRAQVERLRKRFGNGVKLE
jgi:uncharacterized protein (TIGR02996 family)